MKQLLTMSLLLFGFGLKAQYVENFVHTYDSRELYNPAAMGMNKCGEATFIDRRQWMGFEGAPVANLFSFSNHTQPSLHGNFHAYGLQVAREKYGFFQSLLFRPSYAFHLRTRRD
jgi:hypothetical protein